MNERKPMNCKTIFSLLTLIVTLVACKSKYKIQQYALVNNIKLCDSCDQKKVWTGSPRKSIVIVSDSTLNYTRIVGGFGASTKIKYQIINDTLSLKTLDIYGRSVPENFKDYSDAYLYNSDSLISLKNNEKYFSANYLESINNKFEHYYVIVDNKKIKFTNRKKAVRVLKRLVKQNRELIELNKESAFLNHGISKEFRTYITKK